VANIKNPLINRKLLILRTQKMHKTHPSIVSLRIYCEFDQLRRPLIPRCRELPYSSIVAVVHWLRRSAGGPIGACLKWPTMRTGLRTDEGPAISSTPQACGAVVIIRAEGA